MSRARQVSARDVAIRAKIDPNNAHEMGAFDRLPAAVRARLNASEFDFSPLRLAQDKRCFRLTTAETLAFLDELERWGREQIAKAQGISGVGNRGDGNRLDAAEEPDVDAMVERVRKM